MFTKILPEYSLATLLYKGTIILSFYFKKQNNLIISFSKAKIVFLIVSCVL